MAERFRGEIVVTLDGVAYTLRMDLNAMADFEDQTGKAAIEWAEKAESGDARVRDLITMVHCAMARHHADADRRLAGDILSEDPELVGRLFLAAAPQAGEIEAAPGK
ncbi:GTA-gp10 family protein [Marinibacterium profundimaris]|uniref:GTA-gp10 family protein n=1 Tax=Marinibacterium profundimaris TaxID=1679460 RepID=UPI000B51EA1F|nr:GTA-gp10 family protein [Marinibacterium profundimaris]